MELEKEAEFEHHFEEEEEKGHLLPPTCATGIEEYVVEGVHFALPLKDPRSKFYVLVKKLIFLVLFVGFLLGSLALRFELQSSPAFAPKLLNSTHNTTFSNITIGK